MAGFDYGKIQTTAGKIMDKFTQATTSEPVALVKTSPGGGPSYSPGAAVETVVLLAATATGVPSKFIQDKLAIAGDLMVIAKVVDGVAVDQARDVIRIGERRYKIVEFMPTPPVGVAVVWKFIVRFG